MSENPENSYQDIVRDVNCDFEFRECYQVSICRLFNIFNPEFWTRVVFAGFISLAFLFLGFLARNLIPIKYALILCGIVTLLSFIFLLTFPKQIEVTKTAVRIQHHTAFLKLLFVAIVSFCTKTRHTRDSELYISPCFTVFEIDYITYSHSKIEKFFHTGHIEVTGKYYSNLSDSFSECTFSVYGIKDFENTAAWMQSYIHLVE